MSENKIYGVFNISFEKSSSSKKEALEKQFIFEALYKDNFYPFGFWAEAVANDKETAKSIVYKLREQNSQSCSTSRLVQCGLWSHSIIIHEAYKVGREYHWKLSEKELEAARKTELYQRVKAEYEAKNVESK